MSSADSHIYADVDQNEVIDKPFIFKEMQQLYDLNNGVYSNQIQFSTASLQSGAGKWLDLQNSYFEIPFTMVVKGSVALTGASSFSAGIKNGSIQLVDAITLQYNGTQVAQNSIFLNIIRSFKILNTWSYSDWVKWGAATMTSYPDNTVAYRGADTGANAALGTAHGDGTPNNTVLGYNVAATAVSYAATATNPYLISNMEVNDGYFQRLASVQNANSVVTNGLTYPSNGNNQIVAKPFYSAGASNTYVWQAMLTLRAKDLHDFFNKMPIIKQGRIDLLITFNSFGGTVTYTGPNSAGGADAKMLSASGIQYTGHSNPMMISSAAGYVSSATTGLLPQPNCALVATANPGTAVNLTYGCGINGVQANANLNNAATGITPPFANCRWYIPVLEMNAEYEESLIAAHPTKTFYYDDFYTYTTITNVSKGASFQYVLSAGVKNPKWVVLVPFSNSATANSGIAQSLSPYQSPFDSAPATASPLIQLTNFQVFCGGRNMFPLTELYNFQQFMDEFSTFGGVNGGRSILTTGQISQKWWENAPIYVCDVSRRLPADDASSKSISVSGTVNYAPYGGAIDIIAFVIYGRSATINTLNGTLVNAE